MLIAKVETNEDSTLVFFIGGIMQGLIIENISNLYKIKTENGKYEANARGKFKKEEITPVVGDKVEIQILDEDNKKAVIEKIEQRKTYIKRPKMANLTQIIFVVSIKMPKTDLLLLDKQIAYAEYKGIRPIICINKIDLDEDNITKNIEGEFENQVNNIEKLEKYTKNWSVYFNNKDFDGMQREFEKIKDKIKNVAPIENTIKNARTVENLHMLIKNNGKNFNLTDEELALVKML